MNQESLLIYGANEAGENFIRTLQQHDTYFIALAFNPVQQRRLLELGIQSIFFVENIDSPFLDSPISKAFIFEDDICQCCKVIEYVCKSIPQKKIYVITHDNRPMLMHIYKELGAGFVIYTHSNDMAFLMTNN